MVNFTTILSLLLPTWQDLETSRLIKLGRLVQIACNLTLCPGSFTICKSKLAEHQPAFVAQFHVYWCYMTSCIRLLLPWFLVMISCTIKPWALVSPLLSKSFLVGIYHSSECCMCLHISTRFILLETSTLSTSFLFYRAEIRCHVALCL